MEKIITDEMELLDDWDFLSDDGFVDVHPRENVGKDELITDYFSSCKSPMFFDEEIVKEVIKVGDQEMISPKHVSFKKETEFVDMKMDSPKSGSKGIVPFIDTQEDGSMEVEEKEELVQEKKCVEEEEESGHGLNMWGWKLSGIGAICSIGMAAVTVCIFILGRSQQKQQHQLHNQKLRFQIYTDEKRFKQVVHHASKLNHAVSSVRSGPFNRAQFTLGGYYVYDGI